MGSLNPGILVLGISGGSAPGGIREWSLILVLGILGIPGSSASAEIRVLFWDPDPWEAPDFWEAPDPWEDPNPGFSPSRCQEEDKGHQEQREPCLE